MKSQETILIIGGSSGMGLTTAALALEEGYKVIIASRSAKKLAAASEQLNHNHLRTISVDIRDSNSISKLFADINSLDHLIISASDIRYGNIFTETVEGAKSSFDSKFWGPFRVVQNALSIMNPEGSITFISGASGQKPASGREILAAINSALEGFARGLAKSLAPLRVNTIAPGIIDTPVYADMDPEAKKAFLETLQSLLIKRMGSAREIAEAALFLVKNNYTTGQTLFIEGGYLLS